MDGKDPNLNKFQSFIILKKRNYIPILILVNILII